MTWTALIPLVIDYGIPFAEKMWQLWSTATAPTQADWDALKALAAQNGRTQMLAALSRAGIDPNSDQGKAFLALVS